MGRSQSSIFLLELTSTDSSSKVVCGVLVLCSKKLVIGEHETLSLHTYGFHLELKLKSIPEKH